MKLRNLSILALLAATGTASAVIVIAPATTPFIDISGTGTSIGALTDDSESSVLVSALQTAGFTGNALLSTTVTGGAILVGNNGAILWGTDATHNQIGYTNANILTMTASNLTNTGNGGTAPAIQFLCPHNDDLFPTAANSPSVKWQVVDADADGQVDDLVVQWTAEDHFSATGTGTITFECIVYSTANPNGPFIDYVYQDTAFGAGALQNDGGSATIGFKNWGVSAIGSDVQWSFNWLDGGAIGTGVTGYVEQGTGTGPHALRIGVPITLTGSGSSTPSSGIAGSATTHLAVSLSPASAANTTVTINLSTLGGATNAQMFDDGAHGDGAAGDLVFGLDYAIPGAQAAGPRTLPWSATSTNAGNTTGSIGFSVVTPPATIFDFGDMSVPHAASQTFDVAAAEVKWFKFNLTTAADAGLGTFVDMDTAGSACTDTEIGVYGSDGALIVSDDDSGPGLESLLTFGTGTRLALTDGTCGTGIAYDGLDGNLPVGTYYVAAGRFNMNFNATNWNVTSTGVAATGLVYNIRSVALSTIPTGTGTCTPNSLRTDLGGTTVLAVNVTPGTTPDSTGITVTADASGAGGSAAITLLDDGNAPDAVGGDNIFSANVVIPAGGSVGAHPIAFTVSDAELRTSSGNAAFSITAPPPLAGTGTATPNPVVEGNNVTLTVTVTPGAAPTSTGISVSADASAIGGGTVTLLDDGNAPDATAGDNIFTADVLAAPATTGAKTVVFTVNDAQARTATGNINFTVSASATGSCCGAGGVCTIDREYPCTTGGGSFTAGGNCGGSTYAFTLGGGSAFEDISGTGTDISAAPGDDGNFNVALSFPFTFYGTTFNSVNVCTNGFMSFDSTSTSFANLPIPNTALPNNLLAVLWDDYNFNVNASDSLKTETRGTSGVDLRQIFQWTTVAQFLSTAETDFNTFQCVLFEDGHVEYRYGDISDNSFEGLTGNPGATVGVEDATGSSLSVQYGTGDAVVSSNTNISIVAVSVPSPCDACARADFNHDGDRNPDDLGDFITCYFGEAQTPGTCPAADFNADNDVNPDDLGDFITLYFGCV